MSERKIRTFHIPLDRVRQYLTVEEIEACVGGHVKCAIYADVSAFLERNQYNLVRALFGLPSKDWMTQIESDVLKGQVEQLKFAVEHYKSENERLRAELEGK